MMGRWLWMTGGLVVWAIHFTALYLLASLADVVASADDPTGRAIGGAISLAALLTCLGLLVAALRRRGSRPSLVDDLAAASGALGAVAVAWQSLPLVIGY